MFWKYILEAPVLEIQILANELQSLRDLVNCKFQKENGREIGVQITSGLRAKEWELFRGRSGNSQHIYGHAADFRFVGVKDARLLKKINEFTIQHYKYWMGGLAHTKSFSFIHLDHRAAEPLHISRGYGARWVY